MKKLSTPETIKRKRGRPRTSDKGDVLSIREEEVLIHLKDGKQYAQVGTVLCISTETVRKHVHKIYKKLGVENKIQAINKFFGNN